MYCLIIIGLQVQPASGQNIIYPQYYQPDYYSPYWSYYQPYTTYQPFSSYLLYNNYSFYQQPYLYRTYVVVPPQPAYGAWRFRWESSCTRRARYTRRDVMPHLQDDIIEQTKKPRAAQ